MGRFRQRLHNIYMTSESAESKDRTWLCQLLVVLALSESVDASRKAEVNHRNESALHIPGHDSSVSPIDPPGKEFFEHALKLLNVPFENASVEHIEILNMIVSP